MKTIPPLLVFVHQQHERQQRINYQKTSLIGQETYFGCRQQHENNRLS